MLNLFYEGYDLLKNKTAIITGASKGIGRAIALNFAASGANLVLTCLQDEKSLISVKKHAENLGVRATTLIGDISSIEFCEKVIDCAIRKFSKVDILVNSAGMITRETSEKLDHKLWNRVIDVNLNGIFFLCQKVLPYMRERKSGKIINLTSQMAFRPHPSASPSYEVSKTGITALSRHLALEYAEFGICVNNIAPGSIDTDLPKSMTKEQRKKLKEGIPMKRLGDVKEVADAALFLASDMSSYITGSTIHVNGGSTIL